jgi:hypothetical protein
MRTIQVREKTGADGVLNLRIPIGEAEADCDVVVVVQPKPRDGHAPTPEELGWPPGYFEKTYGSIDDETFVRHPQGSYPKRLELE